MLKNEVLTFDKVNHIYTLMPSGRIIPGTTEIIESVFPFNGRGLAVDRAADFGTAVHLAISLEIEGVLNWKSLDDAIIPYIKQWSMAMEKLKIQLRRCIPEEMLWSKKYLTAGTIDLIDEEYIDDWKTGHPSDTHRVQVANYRHLWNINNPNNKRKKGRIFYLSGSDKMPTIVEEQPSDFNTFLACLEIYNFKRKENL